MITMRTNLRAVPAVNMNGERHLQYSESRTAYCLLVLLWYIVTTGTHQLLLAVLAVTEGLDGRYQHVPGGTSTR